MDKKTVTAIERWNIIIGIAMVAASVVFWRLDVFVGMAVGVGLGAVNFMAIRWVVGKFMVVKESARGALAGALLVKMLGLIVLVFLAIKYLPMNALAFAAGISVFFVSILIETARIGSRPRHNGGSA